MRFGGRRAGSLALAGVAVLLATGLGPTATAAEDTGPVSSEGRALPDLPWETINLVARVTDVVSGPPRWIALQVSGAAGAVPLLEPVAEPVTQSLALLDAAFPLVIDGTGLLAEIGPDLPEMESVASSEVPAWQLPPLPDVPDFNGRIRGLAGDLTALEAAISSADACDCLGSQVNGLLDGTAGPLATVTDGLATYLPLLDVYEDLTGFRGARTYLLVIGNQAEMRPSGGAPLYAAVVTVDNGLVRLEDKGTTGTHFFPPMNRPVTWEGVDGNPFYSDNPRTQPFVNAGFHPDFSVSAQEMAAAFTAGGHPTIDGVIYVDLSLLQHMLEATGPIEAPGLGQVDAANVVDLLLDNAYEDVVTKAENAQRQAANDALVDALVASWTSGAPSMDMVRALEDGARQRHLQVWFREAPVASVFEDLEWTGRLVAPATGDWLAWYTTSGNPSKTDIRQRRSVERTVDMASGGTQVTSTYLVENVNPPRNDGRSDEKRGYKATWMKVAVVAYLPPEAANVRLVTSEPFKTSPLDRVQQAAGVMEDAQGLRFVRVSGWIEPLSSASFTVTYDLPSASSYEVIMEPQVALDPYVAVIDVHSAGESLDSFGPAPISETTEFRTSP